MRRLVPLVLLLALLFQFTHPGKGATVKKALSNTLMDVSIHAPWEGCDYWDRAISIRVLGFNSRTLGRVRHQRAYQRACKLVFQFTHPGKGATYPKDSRAVYKGRFNSRTLGRVRRCYILSVSLHQLFQFTHPGKGATISNNFTTKVFIVSIHAPWEGCDSVVQRCVL